MHVARVVAIGLSISMVSSQAAGQPEGRPEQSSPDRSTNHSGTKRIGVRFATLSSALTSGIA